MIRSRRSSSRLGNEQGAILIQVAVAMLALLALSSFVFDYGVMWVSRSQAQNAADAGALSGALSLAFNGPTDQAGARARAIVTAAGVIDRVTLRAQSFFDPLPAGADLYLLKSILSDWPDREATAILRRSAEAARPAGRVVILSGVAPDDGPPPPDVLMLVLVGGKDRTLAEFRALATEAGLSVLRAGRNASGRFIVECGAR